MSHPVKGVDHVFLLVDDLERSAGHWRRLGFTLSPRGLHSKEKGTGNYTIMLQDDYVELLGIVAETPGNLHQREKLAAEGEGLHAIACRIANARDAKAGLTELNIATGDVGAFSRPVQLPGGGEGVAAFETVSFDDAEVPQGMMFMCQHKTRDTVWLPELQEHANGAQEIAAIVAISASPEADAARYARLFAEGSVTVRDGVAIVSTGPRSAEILVASPEAAARLYPGVDLAATPKKAFAALRIRVRSLDAAKAALKANGVAWTETPSGLAAAPADADGTLLELV